MAEKLNYCEKAGHVLSMVTETKISYKPQDLLSYGNANR